MGFPVGGVKCGARIQSSVSRGFEHSYWVGRLGPEVVFEDRLEVFVSLRWRERAALRQGPVWVSLEEIGEIDGLCRLCGLFN